MGGHPGLRHPGRAAGRHHRHPARCAGRVHRPRVRPELVRDGPLPRQGLRHGPPRRLHRRPARRAQASCCASGVTFPDDAANTARWRRWYRLLLIDMWGVFFVGAILGMLLPTILMAHAVDVSGEKPTTANVPTFVASALQPEYGQLMFYGAAAARRADPVQHPAGHLRGDGAGHHRRRPRHQPAAAPAHRGRPAPVLLPVHAGAARDHRVILHLALPVSLVQWSANMSNLGALIFPFLLMYLNSRLPRPARPRPWHYVILVAELPVLRVLLRQLHRRLLRRPAGHLLIHYETQLRPGARAPGRSLCQ